MNATLLNSLDKKELIQMVQRLEKNSTTMQSQIRIAMSMLMKTGVDDSVRVSEAIAALTKQNIESIERFDSTGGGSISNAGLTTSNSKDCKQPDDKRKYCELEKNNILKALLAITF